VIGVVATDRVGFRAQSQREQARSRVRLESTTLVASELATKTDFDVIQVIAEHAALGEQATDEGGPSDGSDSDA
jgi:hypothetical protein